MSADQPPPPKVRGMVCPVCLVRHGRAVRLRVVKTHAASRFVVRRRRGCPACGFRRTTAERWESPAEAADQDPEKPQGSGGAVGVNKC